MVPTTTLKAMNIAHPPKMLVLLSILWAVRKKRLIKGEEDAPRCWRFCHFTPSERDFNDTMSGLKAPCRELERFKRFIDEELVESVVQETNRYSHELKEKTAPGVKGKLSKWVNTTISEMYTFLVTVLLMGLAKKVFVRDY